MSRRPGCLGAKIGALAEEVAFLSESEPNSLEGEVELMMARHGIRVPADRKAGVFSGFVELRKVATALRQPRAATSESSNVFNPSEILRSGQAHHG